MKPANLHLPPTALLFAAIAAAQTPALVRDINPGAASSQPRQAADLGAFTLLWAEEPVHGRELWRTDGTTAGTVLVADLTPGASGSLAAPMVVAGGRAFFTFNTTALGTELYATDGTTAGTGLVRDLLPNQTSTDPADLTPFGSRLLFTARTVGLGERELYVSDGTWNGTVQVKDIRPGFPGSNPRFLTVLGQRALFVANDGVTGDELWETDGTAAGTRLVVDLEPGPASPDISAMAAVGDALYLRVGSPTQLWTSDGTGPGTRRLATLPGLLQNSNGLSANASLGSKAVFLVGYPYPSGAELWVTDGTAAGTQRLATGARPDFMAWGGQVWFARDDGVTGVEPWVTDGTPSGTRRFADLVPGVAASYPWPRLGLASCLLFRVSNPTTGRSELWSTDGSVAGTIRLHADVMDPICASGSRNAWFSAYDTSNGLEVWRTDGTPGRTLRVSDLVPGLGSGVPDNFFLANGRVLFSATDGAVGYELFALDAGATNERLGQSCAAGARAPGLRVTDPVLGGNAEFAAQSLPPGSVALVLLGPPAWPPLAVGGCLVHVDVARAIVQGPFAAPAGAVQFSIPVPNAPELAGVALAAQALAGPALGPLGVDLTHAVLMTPGL